MTERYGYSAYGSASIFDAAGTPVGSSSSSVGSPCAFTGRRHDGETGLHFYRARYYDGRLGRFVGRDPVAYEGSEWNLHEYGGSSPAVRLDPSGLKPPTPFGYGQFCGPTRRAKCMLVGGVYVPSPPPFNKPPDDALDAACAVHDCCLYGKMEVLKEYCGKSPCNTAFCATVGAINCDAIYPTDTVKAYRCNEMKRKALIALCPATGIFGRLF